MANEEAHIVAEIEIEATPQQVWDVLMDYERLPEWSNAFLGTDKPMAEGEISTAYFKNPLTHGRLEFTHTVILYEPGRAFGWSGEVGHGHHDRHIYTMEPTDDGNTLFRQLDGLYGKPSSVLSRMVENGIEASYRSFNKALKARVEALCPR